ncbi:AraC family transcriptional regulator [Candidatus Gracilibacteria bacterium 28_42_T64]|nr:AraC family transcriptional regulator [Candidatus Gracilibacteria bacterium 28_42_T64]
MERIQRAGFKVAGLKITTSNTQAINEGSIGIAWNDFFSKNIFAKIPNKIDDRIYAVYSNFEEGFSEDNMDKKYDLIIGCKVSDFTGLPKWLSSAEVPEQEYAKFVAIGNLPRAVLKTWEEIWESDIPKNNTFDFEVYSEKSQKGNNSEVDVYVGVN